MSDKFMAIKARIASRRMVLTIAMMLAMVWVLVMQSDFAKAQTVQPQAWPGTLYPSNPGQIPPPVESWRIQTAPATSNSHIKPINKPPSSIPRSVFYGSGQQQTAPKYPTGVYGNIQPVPGVPGAEVMESPLPLAVPAATALTMPVDGPMSPVASAKAMPVKAGAAAEDKGGMKGKGIEAFANGDNFAPDSWSAQLGAYARKSLAESHWKKMKEQIAFIKNLEPVYQEVNVSGKAVTRLRVLVGDGSKKTTSSLCAAMKSVGQGCWIDRL